MIPDFPPRRREVGIDETLMGGGERVNVSRV